MENKPKILVTGSCGRIGRRVLEKFSKNYSVIATDAEPSEKADQQNYYRMDLTSEESVSNTIKKIREEHGDALASVIHLAAYYSFAEQDWAKYQSVTIEGTERLLRNLSKNFQVEQFIFSSTQLVYKPCEVGEEIREDSPLRVEWEYPKSKVITENILFENHGDIPLVILRIAGCYDEECNSIPLSRQIARIYNNSYKKNLFPGNLKHGSPFLHFEDLVEAIYKAVEKRKELPNETVLILGEAKTYSYDAIQRRLGKLLLGEEFQTYEIPKFVAKMGSWVENQLPLYEKPFTQPWMIDIADDHYDLDVSTAKSVLDWEPKRDIYETLPAMIKELKKDPKKWFKAHKIPVPEKES